MRDDDLQGSSDDEGGAEAFDAAEEVDAEEDVPIVEGTDLIRPRIADSSATQVAESPHRPTSPGTEFIHYYQPAPADVDGAELWPEVGGLVVVEPPRSATNPATFRSPRQVRVRRLMFLGVIVTLLTVIGGSAYSLYRMSLDETGLVPSELSHASTGDDGRPAAVAETRVEPGLSLLDEEPPRRGLDADELLKGQVQEVSADGKLVDVTMVQRIAWGKVTIVNLWATYCKPCKRELKGLQEMFADMPVWADSVDFVPLQVADPKDAVWAREQYIELMPNNTRYFLSDPRPRGGVLDVLREMARPSRGSKSSELKLPKPEEVNLPATLVFDCQRNVRLFHVGELHENDFKALTVLIDRLREELGTKGCPRRPRVTTVATPRPAAVPKAPSSPRCGNDICEPPAEDAKNCCDCVTCSNSQDKCTHPPQGEPRCISRSLH